MMDAGWSTRPGHFCHKDTNALNTVGYKELFQPSTALPRRSRRTLITRTRQFAKRQMTWFKRTQKPHGFPTNQSRRTAAERRTEVNGSKEVPHEQVPPLTILIPSPRTLSSMSSLLPDGELSTDEKRAESLVSKDRLGSAVSGNR